MSNVEKCVKDLKHQFKAPDPRFQTRRRFGVNEITGSIELAAMRGHQMGIHDAYKTIRRSHPGAANKILKRYHMNRNGSI